jgi:flavorubredoxin
MMTRCNATSPCAPFRAVPVSEHVYWVGAIDWNVRDFHGYATPNGTTYNAYLILADRVTLIDTVKAPYQREMLSRIASVIDPERIDYLVSNHAEMDHSGCLPSVIDIVKPQNVFASTMGVKALTDHFHMDRDITAVKDGESLSLGNMALTFAETRMLHWPDSMFSYLEADGVLFSNDAFGMHLATSERFDDEIPWPTLEHEAAKYYANIVLPYSGVVMKLLEKLPGLSWSIKAIATDHGPVWREHIDTIINRYVRWAAQRRAMRAVVTYDTMWQSTAKMAEAVAEGILAGGVPVKVMPLASNHRSDIATELLDVGALVVGSPTLNNNIFPTVIDLLTYLKGLRPQGLLAAAFGSYGWSGEGVEQVRELLTAMKAEVVGDPVKVKYVPDQPALEQCYTLGLSVAEALKARQHVES